VFASGVGDGAVYRMATSEDLSHVRASEPGEAAPALGAMRWAVIYREGPLGRDQLGWRMPVPEATLDASLDRLTQTGRIERDRRGAFRCHEMDVPYGSSTGWEAAVFDHFQAVVKTVCCKLRIDPRLGLRLPERLRRPAPTREI